MVLRNLITTNRIGNGVAGILTWHGLILAPFHILRSGGNASHRRRLQPEYLPGERVSFEHYRIESPIRNRIRHRNFSAASRSGAVNHAQHLGGRDRGNAQPVCRGNQPLCKMGTSSAFNAQVTLATMTWHHIMLESPPFCSIRAFRILAVLALAFRRK